MPPFGTKIAKAEHADARDGVDDAETKRLGAVDTSIARKIVCAGGEALTAYVETPMNAGV